MGESYRGCPFKTVTRQSLNFLKAFKFYKQGFLPNQGSWLEQSAKLLDAFHVIERELDIISREKQRQAKHDDTKTQAYGV